MFVNPKLKPKNEFTNLKLDFGPMKLADPLLIKNHNSKVHSMHQFTLSLLRPGLSKLSKQNQESTKTLYPQEARTGGIPPWLLSAKSFLKGERCNINFYIPPFQRKKNYIPNKTALAGRPKLGSRADKRFYF